MREFNKNFNVPYYVMEKIIEYIQLDINDKNRDNRRNSIRILLELLLCSNRLNREQYKFIIEKYCNDENRK